MNKKQRFRAMRIPAVIVAALVFSVLAELFLFNRYALFEERYEMRSGIAAGSAETVLDLGEERYIKTVRIAVDLTEETDYRLVIWDAQGNEIGVWEGRFSPKLGESVINLRTRTAGMVLTFSEVPESDGMMTAANFIEWNPYRMRCFCLLLGLAAWLWLWRPCLLCTSPSPRA